MKKQVLEFSIKEYGSCYVHLLLAIYSSTNTQLLQFSSSQTLKSIFTLISPSITDRSKQRSTQYKKSLSTPMASSSGTAVDEGSTRRQHPYPFHVNAASFVSTRPQYPYPCHVNAACFVSVKLLGSTDSNNYDEWKTQILCLLDCHDMLGFVDGTIMNPQEYDGSKAIVLETSVFKAKCREWEMSDQLVKGWIYGSLSEGVMTRLTTRNDCARLTARTLWNLLRFTYTTDDATKEWSECEKYNSLYRAIELGDWETAQELFNLDKQALVDEITEDGKTALLIAVGNRPNTSFLENLLDLMGVVGEYSLSALAKAFWIAIECGNQVAVEMFVDKYPFVLFLEDGYKSLPAIKIAAINYHRTILDYLFLAYKQNIALAHTDHYSSPFKGRQVYEILQSTINAEYFDVAYDLLKDCYIELELATLGTLDPWGIADILAQIPDAHRSAKQYNFYQRFVYSHVPVKNCTLADIQIENQETCRTDLVTWKSNVYSVMERICDKFWKFALLHVPHIKNLHDDKVTHNKVRSLLIFCCLKNINLTHYGRVQYEQVLILATKNNIPEVIEQITRFFPLSIRHTKDGEYTLYQLAIKNRCEHSYNFLVHEENYHKDFDKKRDCSHRDNLLHLVAKLAPEYKLNKVTGAALQMQMELQWFEEVSKLVSPEERKKHNIDKETPMMVFRKEHKELRQRGEDWMKKTAESYTIIAALIITIAFAAIITVLGGNNEETGRAIYKSRLSFTIFIISDAMSLFTATTSLLWFLSILTARYSDEDFLYKLPKRLIIGLVMLFLSVTTMLIAFSAALHIMAGYENSWILVAIVVMTYLPIASFVTLQLPLLVDLISSTYGRGIFGNRSELRTREN